MAERKCGLAIKKKKKKGILENNKICLLGILWVNRQSGTKSVKSASKKLTLNLQKLIIFVEM